MTIFLGIYNPDIIEAALGHQNTNTIRPAYNPATYWGQRVQLMQDWADLVDQFSWRQQPIL